MKHENAPPNIKKFFVATLLKYINAVFHIVSYKQMSIIRNVNIRKTATFEKLSLYLGDKIPT